MRTAAYIMLLLAIAGGAQAALTRRHLQQTMAGRETRANDAAVLTGVTIGRATSDAPPRGTAVLATKGPAAVGSRPPVTITDVGTTSQGTTLKAATFTKAGPIVNTKAATTIGVKATTNVGHPTDNRPLVGNKGGINAKAGNVNP